MATATGKFVDATNDSDIETQLESLGVTGDKVVVIRVGNKVWLGKVTT